MMVTIREEQVSRTDTRATDSSYAITRRTSLALRAVGFRSHRTLGPSCTTATPHCVPCRKRSLTARSGCALCVNAKAPLKLVMASLNRVGRWFYGANRAMPRHSFATRRVPASRPLAGSPMLVTAGSHTGTYIERGYQLSAHHCGHNDKKIFFTGSLTTMQTRTS